MSIKNKLLDKTNVEDILPLNATQEGLLYHYLNNRNARYYCEQITLELEGPMDREAMEKAWQALLSQHEALRAVFRWEKLRNPVQVIVKDPKLQAVFEELKNGKATASQIQKIKEQDLTLGFDMETIPLRLKLIQLGLERHVLLLSYHHILFDGWSLGIVLKELLEHYERLLVGAEVLRVPRPALKRQLNFLKQQDKEQQCTFWQSYLQEAVPSYFVKAASTLATVPEWRKETLTLTRQPINDFLAQQQLSLATLLYGVWALVLQQYHNSNDLIFGVVVSGRMDAFAGLERMVGLFAQTLPFRVRIAAEDTVEGYLNRIQQQQNPWLAHEHTALIDVQRFAGQEGRGELFDTLIAIENYPIDPQLSAKEKTLRVRDFSFHENDHYNVSLSVNVMEEVEISFSVNTEVLDAPGLHRLTQHFQQALTQLIRNPQTPLRRISLLTAAERQQILHTFNATSTDDPRDRTLLDLLEAQVQQTPNRTALFFADQQLSYQALHQRANQLAHHLRGLSTKAGDHVALCLNRSTEMAVAILAVLKAGAAYVPIDPSSPKERIRFLLQDSQCSVVLTNAQSQSQLPVDAPALKVLNLEQDWPSIAEAPAGPPAIQLRPDHLAYIIYTSGSTGTPKGVMVSHGSLQLRLTNERQLLQFNDQSVTCLLTNYIFDVSLLEIFLPWICGGALLIPEEADLYETDALFQKMATHQVSILQGTPSYLSILIEALSSEQAQQLSLQGICIGGESLNAALVRQIQRRLPGVSINNHYGPTEATIDAIIDPNISSFDQNIIGRPMANTEAYIVDTHLRLLPIGAVGELLLGGPALAQAYWNREALTAECFIPHPFKNDPQARVYKTGDLAKWLPDGRLLFLGRSDDQIKIRGHRIELGEIEAQLNQYADIQQAVVLVRKEAKESYLLAYLLVEESFDEAKCLIYLQSKLPDYMLPQQLITVAEFPLLPSGKVDKKALPVPEAVLLQRTEYAAPRNDVEQALQEIWQSLLGVDRIGIHDNFFELGGHSLLVMRAVAAIRKKLDREIEVRTFFSRPSIAQLANFLQQEIRRQALPPIHPQSATAAIPLSFAQERIWFIDQFEGTQHYHMPALLRLQGPVNEAALAFAFQTLVERHEVLRTVIVRNEERTLQQIQSSEHWQLELLTVEEIGGQEKLLDFIQHSIRRPFDLSKDYMLRAQLIRCGEADYRLVLALHHIAADGWSFAILVKEVMEAYRAFIHQIPSQLPPLPVQYADYALWQREHLQGTFLQQQLDWWEQYLAGVKPLALPTDFPRPARLSNRGASFQFSIKRELVERVKAFAQQEEATLFMTLLAAFKLLLHRYSQQEDICVGTPIANRSHTELEGLIGLFLNTLAIRSSFAEQPNFKDFLQQVKQHTLDVYAHQEVPFEQIVEQVEPERDLSRTPIFQTVFVLQNTPDLPSLELEGLRLTPEELEEQYAKFDLIFSAIEEQEGIIEVTVEYGSDLFREATIAQMAGHYQQLLQAALERPDQTMSELSILTAKERIQLLENFNATAHDYPKNTTLIQLFEEQVVQRSTQEALRFGGKGWTYEELNERANQLGAYLKAKYTIGPEDFAAIALERGEWMIIAILGVLKTGAAYVPIDPNYPQERIDFMLQDSGAAVLVDEKELQQFQQAAAQYSAANPPAAAQSHHLAYLIYTSGSTGQPKGVLTEHRSTINELSYQARNFDLQPEDRILQTANYVFDASIEQIFLPLLFGATLVLTARETLLDPQLLDQLLREENIAHLHATPSLLNTLPPKVYPALKRVLAGGEQCTLELAQSWASYARFFNKYGPTETTINSTIYEYDSAAVQTHPHSLPIGQPLGNTKIYLLDAHQKLVPLGAVGEVYIGGVGVARGYLNREALNREKFIDSPLHPGERLYRTGDLARWLPNGLLEFRGRLDFQVKVRGYRIELGEIERVLQQSEAVQQAVVIARADASGSQQLVAYLVPKDAFDPAALKDFLKARLPEYMIPPLFVELSALPLTTNGKVDRAALPEPDNSGLLGEGQLAPRNATEQELARIWSSLLALESIGVHDNFFELGGHSLLATRIVSAIRQSLYSELAIRDLFECPTIAQLSARIEQQRPPLLPVVQRQERPEQLPLSFSQERLWFIDQLEGSVHYHVPAIFRLKGRLDRTALASAFGAITDRHEVLRTVYVEQRREVYQQLLPEGQWAMAFTVGAVKPEWIAAQVNRPFDLTKDHMLRVHLVQLEAQEHLLIVVMHHIASDGWSVGVLMRELMEVYEAEVAGRPTVLPELPLQYADYAIWQRQYLVGEVLEEKLAYWKQQLAGLAPLVLPTDFPRPAIQSTKGASARFVIESSLVEPLQTLANREEVTLFMVLLGAFKVLLYRYSGQTDICVGSPIANRTQAEIEPLIGFFINTLALRSDLSGNPSFLQFLQQIKAMTLDAYTHQEVPFEKIVDQTSTQRDRSHSPLFQVLLVLQNNAPLPAAQLADLELREERYSYDSTKFDLLLNFFESSRGLELDLSYCTDLYLPTTIERLFQHFYQLLQSIVAAADQQLAQLPMLSEGEVQQLAHFNDTQKEFPADKTLIDLFEAQVALHPADIVLQYQKQQWSYADLNAAANRLGHFLREKYKITPDDRIAICLDVSEWMIIAILGILKAGAAYVPIDPTCPEERKAYLIEDSDSKVLIDADVLAAYQKHSANFSSTNLTTITEPHHLAYVIYTSGSTGQPKGVLIEHRAVVNELYDQYDNFNQQAGDRILLASNYIFDASIEQIFLSLLFNATLVLTDREHILDPVLLDQVLEKEQITHFHATPSLLQTLSPRAYPTLKRVLAGGEHCPMELAQSWAPYTQFFNKYGPTEATINATFYTYDPLTLAPHIQLLPIGRPLANVQLYVLDDYHQLVPIGVVGELYIGGAGLARAYLNQEALTQEKFVDSPFQSGERLYRTGDLVRWLPDGLLEFRGRRDNQVKVRGYRMELGEIEKVLATAEGVQQAAVIAQEDASGAKQLVAYVVANAHFNRSTVDQHLKAYLPNYMIPAFLLTIDTLPLLPTGKLDQKALPKPAASDMQQRTYVAPRHPEEQTLTTIWEELLQLERIGIHDNFFELGGHSLLATRMASAVREELSTRLAIRDIFAQPTIAELAKIINQQTGVKLLSKITPTERPDRIPLSFAQERLWFIDRLAGSRHYHVPAILRIKGALDEAALQAAFSAIVDRHEVLRTVFLEEEGQAYQKVLMPGQWTWRVEEIASEDYEEQIAQAINMPFDLSKDYMLRVQLLKLGAADYCLVIVMHHIASDGWSTPILIRELMSDYQQLKNGRLLLTAPPAIQYADYALWQRQHLNEERLTQGLDYWEQKLRGLAPLDLPTDFRRPVQQSTRGAAIHFELDLELMNALRELAQQQGVSLFMLLLSAYKVLLYRYSGQEDLCVGSPIANRRQAALEPMIGLFINTLALRSDLSNRPSFIELLAQVKQRTLEAYEYQSIPFEKIVERLGEERDGSRTPVFQTIFVLQNNEALPELNIEGVEIALEEDKAETAKLDLVFSAVEHPEGLRADFQYCRDLFERRTMEQMGFHFQQLLRSIVRAPRQRIDQLSMLSPAERYELLETYTATEFDVPTSATLTQLVEEQVARHPDQITLCFEDRSLTYGELNTAANQLGHYLRQHYQIQPDDRIAIQLERSEWMIIAILGVLKSGAAYVPIDPSYPEERARFMLEDSASKVLIDDEFLQAFKAVSTPYPKDNPLLIAQAHHLSYIIYTSGSTGRPKGVLTEHRCVVNELFYQYAICDLRSDDCMLQTSNYVFDPSVEQIFLSLIFGVRLVLLSRETLLDPAAMDRMISTEVVTHLHATPSLLQIIRPKAYPHLRRVLVGGERCPLALARPWAKIARFFNKYGPTETTINSTVYEYEESTALDHLASLPLGKPLANTRVYVLDTYGNLVPKGVVGEVYIGGAGVSRGYLNREELTKEKFIDSPFVAGDRLYRSGDLARWLPDGQLAFRGRVDFQVKVRGYRIELGEITRALEQMAAVQQAVVVARPDASGHQRLIAYVLPSGSFEAATIKAGLQAQLPEYMVPSVIIELDTFPLTPNGKIDRRALPDPDELTLAAREFVAPRNAIEERLAIIWQELLYTPEVSIYDNFFELGGHSLLVMRVVAAIKREFSIDIPIKMLFQFTCIADLGEYIQVKQLVKKEEDDGEVQVVEL
ncbi:MAG: amino acid adenylation domain-containing protein [Bacteroidota bacterium]